MASQLHGTVLAPREGSLDAMKIVEPIFPFSVSTTDQPTETTETSFLLLSSTLESGTAIPTATQTRTLPSRTTSSSRMTIASSTPENTQDSGTEATLDTGSQPTQTVTDTQAVNTFGPTQGPGSQSLQHMTSPPSIDNVSTSSEAGTTLSVSTTTYSMSSIGFTVNATSPSTSLSSTISQHTSASSSDSSIQSNGARSKNSHFPAGAIGGIVGGVVLLLFTLAFVVCILRKRARGSIVGLENAAHPYRTAGDSAPMHDDTASSRLSLSAGQETLAAEPAVKLEREDSSLPPDNSGSDSRPQRSSQLPEEMPSTVDHARQLSLPQSSAPNDNRDTSEPSRNPYPVVDPSSLTGLVERVTRAILSNPQLGRTLDIAEEAPPRYQE